MGDSMSETCPVWASYVQASCAAHWGSEGLLAMQGSPPYSMHALSWARWTKLYFLYWVCRISKIPIFDFSGTRAGGEQCTFCNGRGHRRCSPCHGRGHVQCHTCRGSGSLVHYLQLTVDFKDHDDDYVFEKTDLPDKESLNNTWFRRFYTLSNWKKVNSGCNWTRVIKWNGV